MARDLLVDPDALREQVRGKYREVAHHPGAGFHFHTGRRLASRLGYDAGAVGALPDRAVESFAGVGNPFSLRPLAPGEHDFSSPTSPTAAPCQPRRCATSTCGPVE